jgi:hypothetical protein
MRILSPALIAELALTVTRPGYLVSVGFSTPQYYSTLGTVTWDGHTWLGTSIKVDGLQRTTKTGRDALLRFGDSDQAIAAIALNEGVTDRAIKIYSVYAGAPSDAVLELSGAGDACEVNGDSTTISVAEFSTSRAMLPRRRVGKETGFNAMVPSGAGIWIGGQIYFLVRE